jgi:hypothetical protein
MQDARAEGVTCAYWAATHKGAFLGRDGLTWDGALGEMFARRASSIVHEDPVVSLTGFWIWFWGSTSSDSFSGFLMQCLYLGVGTPLCLPFDAAIVPASFTASWIRDMRVSAADHEAALEDLQRARDLGYEDPERWMR